MTNKVTSDSYTEGPLISHARNGYNDLLAVPDLQSFRRIPWEDDVPFFLVKFLDPNTKESISACPRSLLKRIAQKVGEAGVTAMAGGEQPSKHQTASGKDSILTRCSGIRIQPLLVEER